MVQPTPRQQLLPVVVVVVLARCAHDVDPPEANTAGVDPPGNDEPPGNHEPSTPREHASPGSGDFPEDRDLPEGREDLHEPIEPASSDPTPPLLWAAAAVLRVVVGLTAAAVLLVTGLASADALTTQLWGGAFFLLVDSVLRGRRMP